MHTPAAALAWELWRRHRTRLTAIFGLLLGFIFVYPKLCALAGVNLDSPNGLDEIVRQFVGEGRHVMSVRRIVFMIYAIFLALGPMGSMFLTLLFLAWVFTLTAPDPKTKDPLAFPTRLFTLPVSTPFLFWSLLLAGQAAMVLFFESWVCLVRMPQLDIFGAYRICFGWMTLLALTQGIIWALAAWPTTRIVVLTAVFFGFTYSPARPDIFESPYVLPPLFILGVVLARAGLQKMRHGQWQGWDWERALSKLTSRVEWREPKRFSSPGVAQVWFEWRRFARPLCLMVAGVTVLPVTILVLVRFVFGLGPLQNDTMFAICVELLLAALLLHGCFSLSASKADLPFSMSRPQTNGQVVMAALKAATISTVISWVLVLAALWAMCLLGSFAAAEKVVNLGPHFRVLVVLGLMLLTWRLIPVNLCFVWSGNRYLSGLPVMIFMLSYVGGFALNVLSKNEEYWDRFWKAVPALLACLVILKFLLALLAFGACLKRRLLSPSSMLSYLGVWASLVAVLVIPMVILFYNQPWLGTTCLGIILLTPLARIGFAPITLAWNRHA